MWWSSGQCLIAFGLPVPGSVFGPGGAFPQGGQWGGRTHCEYCSHKLEKNARPCWLLLGKNKKKYIWNVKNTKYAGRPYWTGRWSRGRPAGPRGWCLSAPWGLIAGAASPAGQCPAPGSHLAADPAGRGGRPPPCQPPEQKTRVSLETARQQLIKVSLETDGQQLIKASL